MIMYRDKETKQLFPLPTVFEASEDAEFVYFDSDTGLYIPIDKEFYSKVVQGEGVQLAKITDVEAVDGKVEEYVSRIEADMQGVKMAKANLFNSYDFEEVPFYSSRSEVYSFQAGMTEPQRLGKKTLMIRTTGYEASKDPNKDFAFLLNKAVNIGEPIKIAFWVYPTIANKTFTIRMAWSSGVTITLPEPNKWTYVEIELDNKLVGRKSSYMYINLNSSHTIYLSDMTVNFVKDEESARLQYSDSLYKVSDKLTESASKIRNSKGIIERMIANGQTYHDHASEMLYGNTYTAYDSEVTRVREIAPKEFEIDPNGQYQIDCSSFANLMLRGVPWEKSRYHTGLEKNIEDPIFFGNGDSYRYRYANEIARYAWEKGYAFLPKPDLSNLEAGDLMFFSWDNFGGNGDSVSLEARNRNNFLKIDHVGVFLHKKNESKWATLQFNNGIQDVYYEPNNGYMNQMVLVARFPFANAESLYSEENLIINGDQPKSTSTDALIGTYKLTKPLKKGQYYSVFLEGQVNTDTCYFIIQANGQTIFSDNGKIGKYEDGVIDLRFPYHLDEPADSISIMIGAPTADVGTERNGFVEWVSLYEGYPMNKSKYEAPINAPAVKSFPLISSLVSDLNSSMAPYYKYTVDGNKLFVSLSLPFSTFRTGNLTIGNIGSDKPSSTQRIPINLQGENGEAINGIVQFGSNGDVIIVPYSSTVKWRLGLANGVVFR
jgi:hypothetical protein